MSRKIEYGFLGSVVIFADCSVFLLQNSVKLSLFGVVGIERKVS